MSDVTLQPTRDEHLGRLSRNSEEIRAQLVEFEKNQRGKGAAFPVGVLESLKQMSGTLQLLQSGVEESEHERRNLLALAELGQVINSSLELTTVLNEVIDTIIRLTGAERAFLMLRNDQDEMDIVVARNWERESLDQNEVEVSRTIIRQVLTNGEAILTTNAKSDPRFGSQESIVAYNLRSILCVPLKVKGKLTGVIYADNRIKEGLFTEKERSLLLAFANQAAVALENARLFESVSRTLDEVTELKNLMQDVFSSIASGVITADFDDVITLVNQAASSILAIPQDRLLGSSLRELLPPIEASLQEKVDLAKAADEKFIDVEVDSVLSDRGPVNLSLNISPLKTAEEMTTGVAIVVDDHTERRRLEGQRRLFQRMVSPAVIEQLDPDGLRLGGQRANITTLFADIRGYTSFSGTVEPEELVSVLNQYLAAAAEAVLLEEGTIDKFQGDAVMAWFNAPVPQTDHTMRAVRASLGILSAVKQIHLKLPETFHLSLGIGIHYGEAVLGLVGTQKRLDYTAIGDSVNIAKRLQENALPGQILISREASDRVRDWIEVEDIAPLEIDGKREPIEVFQLLALNRS